MNRVKLSDRILPRYSKGEEIMNMVTHICGGCCGLLLAILCCIKAIQSQSITNLVACLVYAITITTLYTMSSIYHGLKPGTGKKVLQILDHCSIYFLICGTYTPILLIAFLPVYPYICVGLLLFQWVLAALATTLTAIDLKKYNVFSMFCYIGMGWSILFFIPQTIKVISHSGFYLLLYGGISYTMGAILYRIGSKRRWFHSIFHIFVVAGSILQAFSILLYVL